MRKFITPLLLASSITLSYAADITPITTTAAQSPSIVEMQTNFGTITIQLNHDKAPITSKNFLDYVNSGFYKNTYFHRVVRSTETESNINVVQGGGLELPSGIQKKTNAPIINESNNTLLNKEGSLSMARTTAPNSATSQFFINFTDNPGLDRVDDTNPGYAVFADVILGLDLVKAIGAANLVAFDSKKPNEGTPRAGIYDCGFNYCMKKIYIENMYTSKVVDSINSITRVTVNGTGGKITSLPAGISCTSTSKAASKSCVLSKPFGTNVSLISTPSKGYELRDWSGDCKKETDPKDPTKLLNPLPLTTKITDATTKVTTPKNNNCTATFAKIGS